LAEGLLTLGTVARNARVTRATLYSWIGARLVEPRFRVEETPVFTKAELDEVAALAKERKECRTRLRLSPSEG
jgi:hypothetical protein